VTDTKRKPSVLFISHDASRTGAPLCLNELLDSITNEGAPFSPYLFVTGDGPLLSDWRKRGINLVQTTKRARGSIAIRLRALLRSTVAYIRFLHAVKPRLIYSNTIRNGLEVVVARMLGIRTLVHVHEGEKIMRQYARRLRIASLFTSSFVCASTYSARSLEKVVGRNAAVVPNGIRVQGTDPSVRQSAAESELTLGMVGGIQPNKGQHVAIDALAILLFERKIPVRLKIYGEVEDVKYRQRIGTQIDRLKLGPMVDFCGSTADLAEIYRHLDILVLASFDEAFSRVILEAFAYLKPVVASRVGAVPELVRDNENGLLVPSGDALKLAQAVFRLALDRDLVRRITGNALRDVRERFRLEDTVARLREQVQAALA
jgi:glycosyltransferase involved in cell wall biosynthesis